MSPGIMPDALVTVAVPSFNQGAFLREALQSLFAQETPVEVFVADGGSSDNSLDVIREWQPQLAGWRSHADAGQSAAINEAIARGRAPYVCWLNSDDWLLPGALSTLIAALDRAPAAPFAYGRSWNVTGRGKTPVWVEPFSEQRLSIRCIVSQPASLVRRSAWEAVGGLDPKLHMAMDYDLWWRLLRRFGAPRFVDEFVAVNRIHPASKTASYRRLHYFEATDVVRRHHGRVPLKWRLLWPYAVWLKAARRWLG
jgi:GT2 family glycosyltransferase